MTQILSVPLRTGTGLNDRGHWRTRAKKVKLERAAIGWSLATLTKPAAFPVTVLLRRVSPSYIPIDDDNLPGALKACRDAVATWIGVDDGDRTRVRYAYDQRRGPWSVEIEIAAAA